MHESTFYEKTFTLINIQNNLKFLQIDNGPIKVQN